MHASTQDFSWLAGMSTTYAGRMTNLTQNLTDSVKKLGVTLAYGEKVELGKSTILPVALVSYGYGGGESTEEGQENSSGAGGGGMAVPVGAYVDDEFGTSFRPNIIALIAVSIPLVWTVGHALPRLIKALKK